MIKIEKKDRVLVVDPIHKDAIKLLSKHGFSVTTKLFPDPSALSELVLNHDILICRTNTKLSCDFFAHAKHLVCVALASTGYDQIDIDCAHFHNIAVIGLPSSNKNIDTRIHGNFISTAEHTVLLLLATLGDTYNAISSLKEGRWEKPNFIGLEAYGKTLGLIGFGRIGKLVAVRTQAFGMQTIAYDPYVTREEMADHNTEKVELESLLTQSDVISIHAPKTEGTINLLDKKTFSRMKPGIVIVNVARSEIIDTDALLWALESGIVYRYATDVHLNEPYGIEWQVVNHDKVIATPHIGGSTQEALRRISLSTAESLISFIRHGERANVINPSK